MRRLRTPGAFSLYLLASVLLFARPTLGRMSSGCICIPTTTDEGIETWGFAWWPHALTHLLNPFYPRIIYAPAGIDIAHGTLMPAVALALWPLTALTSPLFSFNVAATLAPALAATTAFHLCLTLCERPLPALVGGWLFGFSTYMLGHETGHLDLTLVFLVPVAVELGVRAVMGRIRPGRAAVDIGVVLALQILISLEIFATMVLFALTAIALAWRSAPAAVRPGLGRLTRATAAGLAGSLIVCSPYLYYALLPGGVSPILTRSTTDSVDLLGVVIPNQLTRVGGIQFLPTTAHFSAGYVEGAVYLGVPLLVLLAVSLALARRSWGVRLAATMFVITLVCALGPRLQVNGHRLIPLPWDIAAHLPLLGVALPDRLVMYSTLAGSLIVAVGLARLRSRRAWIPWGLAALTIVSLWPDTRYPFWHSDPKVPSLFTTDAYRHVLGPAHGTILVLPVGIDGNSMLWQAQAHLGFRMASGYVVPPEAPDPYGSSPLHAALEYAVFDARSAAETRRFIATHAVTHVVMAPLYARYTGWPRLLDSIGWQGRRIDGAIVFAPAPSARAAPEN
ncbi:MAG TPA: hypothetical protein VFN48_08360 [Solirubrobacteraceae bacterium]|nr:hypothetical protein [Solirubrobacteraceae bacterium]